MSDRRRTSLLPANAPYPLRVNGREMESLTAAGTIIPDDPRANILFRYERWQDEVWDYLDTVGEFGYAHWWLAQAISRVRLVAAVRVKGESEPRIMQEGPAADLIVNPEVQKAYLGG